MTSCLPSLSHSGAPAVRVIAAVGSINRAIGVRGGLPWSLPEDYRYFLRSTRSGICIMGRTSFEGFAEAFDDNRVCIVLTRTADVDKLMRKFSELYPAKWAACEAIARRGLHVASTYEEALSTAVALRTAAAGSAAASSTVSVPPRDDERVIWNCGGAAVYEAALESPFTEALYLTEVDLPCSDADTFFPEWRGEASAAVGGGSGTWRKVWEDNATAVDDGGGGGGRDSSAVFRFTRWEKSNAHPDELI